jgi:hypothetical protein
MAANPHNELHSVRKFGTHFNEHILSQQFFILFNINDSLFKFNFRFSGRITDKKIHILIGNIHVLTEFSTKKDTYIPYFFKKWVFGHVLTGEI